MITLAIMETWELIILLFILALAVLPTILALIDIQKSEFRGSNKLIWLLVVLLMSFFGAILYFLIGSEQKTTTNN